MSCLHDLQITIKEVNSGPEPTNRHFGTGRLPRLTLLGCSDWNASPGRQSTPEGAFPQRRLLLVQTAKGVEPGADQRDNNGRAFTLNPFG